MDLVNSATRTYAASPEGPLEVKENLWVVQSLCVVPYLFEQRPAGYGAKYHLAVPSYDGQDRRFKTQFSYPKAIA